MKKFIINIIMCIMLISTVLIPNQVSANTEELSAYVLSYFGGNDTSQCRLYLAYSYDAINWTSLNDNNPVWSDQYMRDPFILRKETGGFVVLWTAGGNQIMMADSEDLITFTNAKYVTMCPTGYDHSWAPEAIYDSTNNRYVIYASCLDPVTLTHSTWAITTSDFASFSSPFELFDPGYDIIDSNIINYNGEYYLFFKDERGQNIQSTPYKALKTAKSSSLVAGSFSMVTPDFITDHLVEGPACLKSLYENKWYLYYDYFMENGKWGCSYSANPGSTTWTEMNSTQFSLPSGVRHGNAVAVTQKELNTLLSVRGGQVDNSYTFSKDYAATQGVRNWRYMQWNGSTYTNLTWNAYMWIGDYTYNVMWRDGLHPDANDIVIAWKAPKSGNVTIKGTPRKSDTGGGDGVNVKIVKNSTQVWPSSGWKNIAYDDSTGITHEFTANVAQNDVLYFIVNKNSNVYNDATIWDPTITYDNSWTASLGFTSSQGTNQWYYKQLNASNYSDMTWNSINGYWKGNTTYTIGGRNWQHPDTNYDSVRIWKAPTTGTVSVKGLVRKAFNGAGGDGVSVKIMKNQTQIWPLNGWQNIPYNDVAGIYHDFTTNVAQNDLIYFIVNMNSESSYDTTVWDPTVSY